MALQARDRDGKTVTNVSAHDEPTNVPWQFSLRSLLVVTAIISVCLAIGVHSSGFIFAIAVMVLIETATILSIEWLARPRNRHALAFVTAGSWIVLGSLFVVLGIRLAYGIVGTGHQSLMRSVGLGIAAAGVFCYYIASRRWRRLRHPTREHM